MVQPAVLAAYGGLLTLATVSIYAGSFATLPTSPEARSLYHSSSRSDNDNQDEEADDEDDASLTVAERMSAADAYMMPVFGAGVLLTLYAILKYVGPEYLNLFIGWYFAFAGTLSVWKTATALLRKALGPAAWRSFKAWKLQLRRGDEDLVDLSFRTPSLLLLPISAIPSALYLFLPGQRRSALLSNVLALSLTHTALAILKLDAFVTGIILLSGLFIYDIYFVFYTEVMVSVATGLDLPIKLVWPKSLVFASTSGFAMLGLGDIVIPGAFISLALRFDFARALAKIRAGVKAGAKPGHGVDGKPVVFTKPYFTTGMVAYVAGLVVTIVVMHVFQAAQPALLYLSPACILSFFIAGALCGDLKVAWAYEDGEESVNAKKEKENQTHEAAEGIEREQAPTNDDVRKRK